MKTVWEYSSRTEALRLLHCAHQMAIGFYKVNNFIVLPAGPKYSNSLIVPFPDLPYTQIPHFWEKAKKVNIRNLPIEAEENFLKSVERLISETKLPQPNISRVKKGWKKSGNKIANEIYKLIPDKKDVITSLTIYPTTIGTSVSFSRPKKFPAPLVTYIREDQDIYSLAEAIVTSLTRSDVYEKLDGVWQESEILVDWILTSSTLSETLKEICPRTNFLPTIKMVRTKQNARLAKESEKFYRKLGVPISENVFAIKADKPTINGKFVQNLTPRESELLKLLIGRSNQLVSVDEVADLIFTNYDDFSLAAIAKAIQRLRDKLEQNGVSGSFIQTLRGQGYLLKN